MNNPNINKLISSRDFAGAISKKDKGEVESSKKEPKAIGRLINMFKKTLGSIDNQIYNPKSTLQRIASKGYDEQPIPFREESVPEEYLLKTKDSFRQKDPISRTLDTTRGVILAGRKGVETVRTELAGPAEGEKTAEVKSALKERGIGVSRNLMPTYPSAESTYGHSLDKLSSDIEKAQKRAESAKHRLELTKSNPAKYTKEEKQNRRAKSKAADKELNKLIKTQKSVSKESNKYEAKRLKMVKRAETDLKKAYYSDKEARDIDAWNKLSNSVKMVKNVASAGLDLVSKKHALRTAQELGAGGVRARNAEIAYALGARDKETRIAAGKYDLNDEERSKKERDKLVKELNQKGFYSGMKYFSEDGVDDLREREAQIIEYLLSKDYSKFESFSEIPRPTVVKSSKVGKETLDTGEILSEAVELPEGEGKSVINDATDILNKNYYGATPEEKKFQESLTMGFSESNDYEESLEALSKMINPY